MATLGRKVSLGLEPKNDAQIVEILSKLPTNSLGRLQLSNRTAGRTLEVALLEAGRASKCAKYDAYRRDQSRE